MSYIPTKDLCYALKDHYCNADKAEKIIINCALVAAGADAVAGIIPGLAIPATIVACFGTVWVMYGKLCETLGITLSEKILKLLARAALANIAANLGSVFIAMFAGMMFPGTSMAASAVTAFVTVYLAGMIFLQLILKLAEQSKDPYSFKDISTDEFKKGVENTKVGREDLEAARKIYQENK